jgi:hypothetical protein
MLRSLQDCSWLYIKSTFHSRSSASGFQAAQMDVTSCQITNEASSTRCRCNQYLQVQILQAAQSHCGGQRLPGGAVAEDKRMHARQRQRQGRGLPVQHPFVFLYACTTKRQWIVGTYAKAAYVRYSCSPVTLGDPQLVTARCAVHAGSKSVSIVLETKHLGPGLCNLAAHVQPVTHIDYESHQQL